MNASAESLAWGGFTEDGHVLLVDWEAPSRRAPFSRVEDLLAALRAAPAPGLPVVGQAAAYALALGAFSGAQTGSNAAGVFRAVEALAAQLAQVPGVSTRLMEQLVASAREHAPLLDGMELAARMLFEARRVQRLEGEAWTAIALHAARALPTRGGVLLLGACGATASGAGPGTAAGPVVQAARAGQDVRAVVATSGPARLGTRFTLPDLAAAGVPARECADLALGACMAGREVHAVVLAAHRVATNGDCLVPLGGYPAAVLAHRHRLPCVVVSRTAAVDRTVSSGNLLTRTPINSSGAEEVVPVDLVTALACDQGLLVPPLRDALTALPLP